MTNENIIEVKNLRTVFGDTVVHDGVALSIKKGEVFAIVGGSGSGKTTLMREILMLQRPTSGSIKVFNQELTTATPRELLEVQKRWGVLFQANALFSSLTILENTSFPLKEHTALSPQTTEALALLKIQMAGLTSADAVKYPAELSGGMQKRAGLARAIVLDPELIFLDEPSAGLDPNNASSLDELVLNLKSTMGLTIVIITHDLDTLWRVTDRVAFLGDGKVLAVDSMVNIVKNPHKLIQEFFHGPRGETAEKGYL
jgi:phospholipid/cholesterol/gamma-HCH transport system ATP-binding protein